MADDLAGFASDLNSMATALTGTAMREIMTAIGVDGKKKLDDAVRPKLGGDNRFSGWPKAAITHGFEHTGNGEIEIGPQRRSQGPAKVAQAGRRAGHKFSRKAGRNVGWGSTRGKGTFDAGMNAISRDFEKVAGNAIFDRIGGVFYGG